MSKRSFNRGKLTRSFVDIPESEWPDTPNASTRRFRVCLNKYFFVQFFIEKDDVIRMSVNRIETNSDGDWKDGITWDELHLIKSQLGYVDKYAIEVYPDLYHIVNASNMRHLWILPKPLSIGWGYGD